MNSNTLPKAISVMLLLVLMACHGNKARQNITKISRIEVMVIGWERVDTNTGTCKEVIIGKNEVLDSNVIIEFQEYKNWEDSPDWRCVRNVRMNLLNGENVVDSMQAVIHKSCLMLEFKENNRSYTKSFPKKLESSLLEIVNDINCKNKNSKIVN